MSHVADGRVKVYFYNEFYVIKKKKKIYTRVKRVSKNY